MTTAVLVLAMGGAAGAEVDANGKKVIATTEQGTYDAINADPKMQRLCLVALLLAADGLQFASKALVATERRMARETVYVNPAALREARRLLEKAEAWRAMAKRQMKDRKLAIPPRKKWVVAADLAACIVVTETDDPVPDECKETDTAAAVKWAISEESDE